MRISSDKFRQIIREEAARNLRTGTKPIYEIRDNRRLLVLESLSPSQLNEKMSTPDGKEEVKKSLMAKFRDSKMVDLGLDLLGTAGGWAADAATAGTMGLGAAPAFLLAAIPDLMNAVRNAARGELIQAGIYFLCALPILGDVIGPVKTALKVTGDVKDATKIVELISKVRTVTKGLKASSAMPGMMDKLKGTLEHHFPNSGAAEIADAAKTMLGDDDEKLKKLLKGELNVGDEVINAAMGKLSSGSGKSAASSDEKKAVSESHRTDRSFKILIGK